MNRFVFSLEAAGMKGESMEDSNKLLLHRQMGDERRNYKAEYLFSSMIMMNELHNHDFYEFYIHVRGGNYYYVNNHVYRLERGNILILPPLEMHGYSSSQTLYDYERAFLYITPERLQHLGGDIVSFEKLFLEQVYSGHLMFNMDEATLSEAVALIRSIASRTAGNSLTDRLEDHADLMRLFVLIYKVVSSGRNVAESVKANPLILSVVEYLNNHFIEPITMEDLSKKFNISKSSLSHQFSSYMNTSLYSYVLYRRILYAKELLHTGVAPQDVAFQCGFSEYSNFLKYFKRMVGLSPRDYLNSIKLP